MCDDGDSGGVLVLDLGVLFEKPLDFFFSRGSKEKLESPVEAEIERFRNESISG